MSRDCDPVCGDPAATVYDGSLRYDAVVTASDRFAPGTDDTRAPAARYVTLPTTLEEEADCGGWLPGAKPTGPPDSLRRLYTLGMRGEPGYDDDPVPDKFNTNTYVSDTPNIDTDNSSWD